MKSELTMEITPCVEQKMKGFPFFLEIEMLQGERQELADGRVKYSITIEDPDKQAAIREFCLKAISHSQNPINDN